MMTATRRIAKRLRREIRLGLGVRGREDDGFRRDGCDSLRAGARRSCARARNDATCRGRDARGDDEARTMSIHWNRG